MVNETFQFPKVIIKGDGVISQVFVDDIPIPGVVKYELVHEPGCLPILKLSIFGEFSVDTPGLVPLPEPWASMGREVSEDRSVSDVEEGKRRYGECMDKRERIIDEMERTVNIHRRAREKNEQDKKRIPESL